MNMKYWLTTRANFHLFPVWVETVVGENMKNGKNVHQRILVWFREQCTYSRSIWAEEHYESSHIRNNKVSHFFYLFRKTVATVFYFHSLQGKYGIITKKNFLVIFLHSWVLECSFSLPHPSPPQMRDNFCSESKFRKTLSPIWCVQTGFLRDMGVWLIFRERSVNRL
jgi:hypothetical protein